MRPILRLLGTLCLMSCERYCVKAEIPEAAFARDDYECAMGLVGAPSDVGVQVNVNSRSAHPSAREVDLDLFRMCMRARGFKLVTLRFESPPSDDYHHSEIDH